jgi:O-antigen/teichoic acid export membrane protein
LNNFGATGILMSFLTNVLVLTVLYFVLLKRKLNFTLGDKKYFVDFIRDALINTPPLLTRSLLFYFSVVLLAFHGINESDIGLYYISMMLSIIAGGFASNTALMLMPSSLVVNKNLSVEGLRISFALTAPIISVLLSEPERILGIIGQQFVQASDLLIIFSLSIIPFVIVTNSISNFNNLNQSKKIMMIGMIQLSVFLISFFILVPSYGVTGGAYSIFISMIISAIFSIIWYGSSILKNISFSCLSIFVVFVLISILNSITEIHLVYSTLIALVITLVLNVLFKNITIFELKEIFYIVTRMLRRNKIQ